jgi:hypothetical protein
VKRPDFRIVGWENEGNVVSITDITPKAPVKALPASMEKEEGPPEYDSDDPGYEPVR